MKQRMDLFKKIIILIVLDNFNETNLSFKAPIILNYVLYTLREYRFNNVSEKIKACSCAKRYNKNEYNSRRHDHHHTKKKVQVNLI